MRSFRDKDKHAEQLGTFPNPSFSTGVYRGHVEQTPVVNIRGAGVGVPRASGHVHC